jgi:hypothetical protein
MKTDTESICPLCQRDLQPPCNKHHLIPVSKGGKGTPTVMLHKICHDKIHAVFTEKELVRNYRSIESLRQHDAMKKFISWVERKEPAYYDGSVRMKR